MPDSPITSEEMNALMEAVQPDAGVTPSESSNRRSVTPYDFANPHKFSKEQLRALEMIYSNCSRGLTTQLSTLMRTPVEVEPDTIQETSYQKFLHSISHTASIALLSIDPLIGRAVLQIDPSISFALVDRLLGGPGHTIAKMRELTEIEKGLMKRVIDRVSKSITDAWSKAIPIQPELEMIISNTVFSQITNPEDRVMMASFQVTFGDVQGTMHFGIPVLALDPVLPRLSAQQWYSTGRRTNSEALTDAIRTSLGKADLEISVELGRAELLVRELLDLQVGDLICLDRKAGTDLDVHVDSQVKFRGQPGQIGRRIGLKITEVVSGEE